MTVYSPRRRAGLLLGAALSLGLGTSLFACTISVPVQSARVAQLETYQQFYKFDDDTRAAEASGVLESVLGSKNRCAVEAAGESARWKTAVDAFSTGGLSTRGQLIVTVSVYPWDPKSFFVEGIGRYSVERFHEKNDTFGELIATADYRVVDTGPTPLAMLDEPDPTMSLLIEQHVVRELGPNVERYIQRSYLALKLRLERLDEGLYGVDYCSQHEVGIVPGDRMEGALAVFPLGCLKFDTPNDGRKLVDFRDRTLAVDSYEGALTHAKKVRARRGVVFQWKGHSACSICQDGNVVAPRAAGPRREPGAANDLPVPTPCPAKSP